MGETTRKTTPSENQIQFITETNMSESVHEATAVENKQQITSNNIVKQDEAISEYLTKKRKLEQITMLNARDEFSFDWFNDPQIANSWFSKQFFNRSVYRRSKIFT